MSKPKRAPSLEEFAATNPSRQSGARCWVCSIPEREAIEAGRAKGISYPQIRRWLVSLGYAEETATKAKLEYHLGHIRRMA